MNAAAAVKEDEMGPREEAAARLRARFGARLRESEPMRRHTSFRIGGPADLWLEVETAEELGEVVSAARAAELPLWVLGSGTNVLVSDRGVRGLVVRLGRGFHFADWTVTGDEAHVRAGASVPFKKLVYDAVERGFAGLEFGEGIPGSLGGGLTMNAGAFGGEIGRVVVALEGVRSDGRLEEIPRARLDFRYRRLELPPGWVITAVRLRLERGDVAAMTARVETAREKRKRNQPLGHPNAGSVFKNPPGTFAGRLLEEAGVKGLRRGDAQVSELHANFIVNLGGARAKDVRALMDEMAARVAARSGVTLEPEIKLVGEW